MALAKRQRGKSPWKWNKSKSMDQSENLRWNKYTLFLTSLICIGQAQCGGDKTYEKRKSRQTETSHLRSAHPCVSLHFASVAQSSLTLCDPMDCSTSGFPVYHQLLEPAQTLGLWVGDAFQPSYLCRPLLLPSIFPSIRVFSNESVLCIRWPKYWSFSISSSNEYSGLTLGLTGLISLQSKGLSRVFSNTTVQKHQFLGAQPSLWSNSHIQTWLLEKP